MASQAAARGIAEQVRKSPCTRVKVAVSDTDGILRGKYLHQEKFLSAIESGFGFCNVVFGWDARACGRSDFEQLFEAAL